MQLIVLLVTTRDRSGVGNRRAQMPAAVEALAGVVGLAIGSFVGVLADRLPREESIVSPPSHCVACSTPIRAADNIPVLSYLVLRGRCRTCGAHIPPRDAMLELGTAMLFVLIAWRVSSVWAVPAYCLLAAGLVAISAIDIEHMRIPSAIVYTTAVLGAPLLVLASAGTHRWSALLERAHRGCGRLRGVLRAVVFRTKGHRLRRRPARRTLRCVPGLDRLPGGRCRLPAELHPGGRAGRRAARSAESGASDADSPRPVPRRRHRDHRALRCADRPCLGSPVAGVSLAAPVAKAQVEAVLNDKGFRRPGHPCG